MTTSYIGMACDRADGRAKVTGAAKYAAEYHQLGLAYGWVVSSTIARGKIAHRRCRQGAGRAGRARSLFARKCAAPGGFRSEL